MNVDLETRLRRAASVLDDETIARIEQPDVVRLDGRPPRPRSWMLAAAAAVVTLVAGLAVVVMVNRDTSPAEPGPTPPPTRPPDDEDISPAPAWLHEGWNELPKAPLDAMDRPHVVATVNGVLVWGNPVGEQTTRGDAGAFLNMTTGEWTKAPVAPARSVGTDGDETSIAVGDEVIFLVEQNAELATFSYNTMTNTWDTIPAPPMFSPDPSVPESSIIWPGPGLGAFAVGDKAVFVRPMPFEIENDEVVQPPAVAIFDTTTRTWSEGSAPPDDLYSVSGTEAGDRIVVVGSTAPGERAMCRPSMYTYVPEADNWQRVPIEPQGMSAPVAGLTYTGAELFGATYTTCALPERSTDPAVQPHARLIDLNSGSSRFVLSPAPITSLRGSWTGRTVAVTDERGYPLFFDPTSDRWHQAPHNLEVEGLPGLGDRSRLRRNFVYASGAMVAWGPYTDGYAYVPPAEFTAENSTAATLPPSTTVPD